jgi:hypothetical protein
LILAPWRLSAWHSFIDAKYLLVQKKLNVNFVKPLDAKSLGEICEALRISDKNLPSVKTK